MFGDLAGGSDGAASIGGGRVVGGRGGIGDATLCWNGAMSS